MPGLISERRRDATERAEDQRVRRLTALDVFLTSWEAEHGALTAEDIAAAAANLRSRQIS